MLTFAQRGLAQAVKSKGVFEGTGVLNPGAREYRNECRPRKSGVRGLCLKSYRPSRQVVSVVGRNPAWERGVSNIPSPDTSACEDTMNERVKIIIRYRVYCYIGRDQYYVNRSSATTYRWETIRTEYPDTFTFAEMRTLMDRFSHLMPKYEEIPLLGEEDE